MQEQWLETVNGDGPRYLAAASDAMLQRRLQGFYLLVLWELGWLPIGRESTAG